MRTSSPVKVVCSILSFDPNWVRNWVESWKIRSWRKIASLIYLLCLGGVDNHHCFCGDFVCEWKRPHLLCSEGEKNGIARVGYFFFHFEHDFEAIVPFSIRRCSSSLSSQYFSHQWKFWVDKISQHMVLSSSLVITWIRWYFLQSLALFYLLDSFIFPFLRFYCGANQFVDGAVILVTNPHRVGFLVAEKSYNTRIIGDFAKVTKLLATVEVAV